MWLHWHWSLGIGSVFGVVAIALRSRADRPVLRPLVTELSFMFGLYTLWRICGQLSVMGVEDALDRGRAIWRWERALWFPNELTLQRWTLPYEWLMQASNIYYATAHATGLGVFLVWLYVRHRDRYPRIRTTLVLATFISLVVELVPVAPPRLVPELGFVDVARLYGQSVYSTTLGPDSFNQLSAMPSVHVAWAALIGWFGWRVSSGRWRWISPAHAVLTVVVVTITANHWLLDGVAAVVILAVADVVSRRIHRVRAAGDDGEGQIVGRSEVNATASTIT